MTTYKKEFINLDPEKVAEFGIWADPDIEGAVQYIVDHSLERPRGRGDRSSRDALEASWSVDEGSPQRHLSVVPPLGEGASTEKEPPDIDYARPA